MISCPSCSGRQAGGSLAGRCGWCIHWHLPAVRARMQEMCRTLGSESFPPESDPGRAPHCACTPHVFCHQWIIHAGIRCRNAREALTSAWWRCMDTGFAFQFAFQLLLPLIAMHDLVRLLACILAAQGHISYFLSGGRMPMLTGIIEFGQACKLAPAPAGQTAQMVRHADCVSTKQTTSRCSVTRDRAACGRPDVQWPRPGGGIVC